MNLTLDELKDKNDIIVESEGIKIVFNSGIEEYIKDSVIDYSKSWFGSGFVIRDSQVFSC